MREAVYHTVVSKKDGHQYVIGDRKYRRELSEWELVETQELGKEKKEETKESVLKKIQEFTDTDLELGFKPASDYEYFELLAEVKRMGVEVSGNPKRDVLEQLYNEATG